MNQMGAYVKSKKLHYGLVIAAFAILSSFLATAPAFAQVDASLCGSLENAFGPYDYRADHHIQAMGDQMPHSEKRLLVEGPHFSARVENLIGAQSGGQSGPPGADIDYTLRAFPNHHRALMAVMRYGEKTNSQQPAGLRRTVECYFERAIRFKPDDTIARIIYSTYLVKNKRVPEAVVQLESATRIAADNAFSHYNIGLAYFDMKIYDRALAQAHRALALGFERMELRDQLEKAGQWKDSVVAAPAEPPAPVPQ